MSSSKVTTCAWILGPLVLLSNSAIGMQFAPMPLKERRTDKQRKECTVVKHFEQYVNDFKSDDQKSLLEFSLKYAPRRVHQLIAQLQDPAFDKTSAKKPIALVGKTGCGKSVLSRAIALSLKRDYCCVPAVYVLSHYRHGTSENYQALFNKIKECKPMPVFILDDVSVVGNGARPRDEDDVEIVNTVCSFIDENCKREDFMMIVNTCEASDIPAELRKRCEVVWMPNI